MTGVKRIALYLISILLISGCVATSETVKPTSAPERPAPVIQAEALQEAPPLAEESTAEVPSSGADVTQITQEVIPQKPTKITYREITNLISEFLDIQSVEGATPEPKFLGTSENNLVTLEIVGEKDDVLQASIKLVYPEDVETVSRDLNNAIMLRFLRNVAPEFTDWLTRVRDIISRFYSMERGSKIEDEIPLVGRNIKVSYDRGRDSITIILKQK